ncbi:MAG: PQQ-dependent sugar dehydrogenase [Saprospiraceae bacterium]|nr:PQQ-dependent sugar dehydrogenase [Saprospiraceae bacterium]
MTRSRFLLLLFAFLPLYSSAQDIMLEPVGSGFALPVDIKHAQDDRLFIVEKGGKIRIMDLSGNVVPTPFLDIDPIVNSTANERGLLGLAFHPDYANNGYFFVNYTGNDGNTRISRFTRNTTDPNLADPNSELVLLVVNQPFSNHNAGDLAFGPDGYLYVGLGDGGSGGDPGNRSQNPEEFLGKMLRLDVDGSIPYGIPTDNPFAQSADTLPEIWALGLRNPWRISFDRMTGDLWIGDVGQDAWEEVDMEPAGSKGGLNYGWRCYEGFAPYNTNGCGPADSYVPPVHVYQNTNAIGCSVTGGYVYRGNQQPSLYGKYIYTDYCTGIFWALEPDGMGGWTNTELANLNNQEFAAFGEDASGELYVAGLGSGIIYRITTPCSLAGGAIGGSVSCPDTCDGEILLEIIGGCAPYSFVITGGGNPPNDPWPGLTDLCAGTYSIFVTDCNGCTLELMAEVVTPDQVPFGITLEGDTLVADEGYLTYDWYLADTLVGTTTEPWWLAGYSGTYSVIARGSDDCPRLSNTVEVQLSGLSWTDQTGLVIFPNPVADRMTLRAGRELDGELILLDVTGREIERVVVRLSAGNQMDWWIADPVPGACFLRWQGKDGISAARGILFSGKID